MRKYLKIRLTIVTLLFIPVAYGCLPETRNMMIGPRTIAPSGPILSVDLIDKKIAFITRILQEDKLDKGDKELAQDLLSAYKTIRFHLQDQSATNDQREIIHILFANLTLLDEKYLLRERLEGPNYSQTITLFALKRKKILEEYLIGDYQGVINDCVELEAAFGPDSLTPEIGLLFAVSLAKKGMLKEAINIGEKIVRELEGKPDLIHLRASLMEWQLDMGNREMALQIYEKLMDNLDEKEGLVMRSRQIFKGEKRTAFQGKILSEDYSARASSFRGQASFQKLLDDVDELIQENEFDTAKLLLIRRKIRAEEGSEMATIDQALRDVELAEDKFQQERNAKLAHEKESLILARRLIEKENFEEAISKIDGLRDEQDMTPEMRKVKDLATEKLINRERNRAAKYFLMARKTSDPAKKEYLLRSSYKILKSLVDQYPSSTLIYKVNDHIKKVRIELDKMGKDLES